MKTIVLEQEVVELEIKPHALLDEYRRLLAREVQARLVAPNRLTSTACPGCRSGLGAEAFAKTGLTYLRCDQCTTVYVSPRPTDAALAEFYRESEASRFWRDRILRETREARREKVFRPRVEWLLSVVDEYRPDVRRAIAVGYHNDLLVEELVRQESEGFQVVVTNPLGDVEFAGIRHPRVMVRASPVAAFASFGPADLVLLFDIVDRSADVEALFAAARDALAPGGLLLVSAMLISGFDLQVLWNRSESIYPPERLNLFSVEGLTTLFERYGFEALEFSTPGTFDVEVVQRAIQADPAWEWPRFIRYLIEHRDEAARNAFQHYLQEFRLSSFARLALRRLP